MTHYMKLQKKPFEAIEKGQKTVEVRLYDRKRSKISVGDTILFTLIGTENVIETLVISVKRFKTFQKLYEYYNDYTCLGYEKGETARSNDMYAYYTEEDESLYGVVALEIKKIY